MPDESPHELIKDMAVLSKPDLQPKTGQLFREELVLKRIDNSHSLDIFLCKMRWCNLPDDIGGVRWNEEAAVLCLAICCVKPWWCALGCWVLTVGCAPRRSFRIWITVAMLRLGRPFLSVRLRFNVPVKVQKPHSENYNARLNITSYLQANGFRILSVH